MPSMTLESLKELAAALSSGALTRDMAGSDPAVCPRSFQEQGHSTFLMARVDGEKRVVEVTRREPVGGLEGPVLKCPGGCVAVVAAKSRANGKALRRLFPWTAPSAVGKRDVTVGCGDRLGLATPGHVQAFRPHDATPMLAQQSVRENTFTGRSHADVLDDATWGVFQEGFTRGFGADGDHLKKGEQVEEVLALGYTFLTLDLSEHIDNAAASLDADALSKALANVPAATRRRFENRYGGKSLAARAHDGKEFTFAATDEQLARITLVYHRAIDQAARIYKDHLEGRGMELEVSIDEVDTPTDPVAHFILASELAEAGVEMVSMAPRFCGEFQKGIDYIGSPDEFAREFAVHAAIARKFGHKVSVHSGSDKFAIFPFVGELTGGRFHLKTAGTSWLQAMLAVAQGAPSLYREVHAWAMENHGEALKLYHIKGKRENVPDIKSLSDEQLPSLFGNDDCRQLLHISYGLVLNSKGTGFREALYSFWNDHEARHDECVRSHLKRHLEALGVGSA